MNLVEQQTLDFMNRFQKIYFDECKDDKKELLTMLSNDIIWIGMNSNELHRGYEAVKYILSIQLPQYPNVISINSCYKTALITNQICAAYGTVEIQTANTMIHSVRISAVCRRKSNVMKAFLIHISLPDENPQEAGFSLGTASLNCESRLSQPGKLPRSFEQQRDLWSFLDNIPGAIQQCCNDEYLTIAGLSAGFVSMFGYTNSEVSSIFNNRYIDMIHPSDRAFVLDSIRKQLAVNNIVELEYRVTCKNGDILWVLDKGQLTVGEDGEQTFFCILVDITHSKIMRDELRSSLEFHKIIIDQTADIIFEWDIARDTLAFSPNWKKKFGYEPSGESVGRLIMIQSYVYPDDSLIFLQAVKDIQLGLPYTEKEFRMQNNDGHFIWCRIHLTTQYDEAGKPVKAVGVIVDIDSERRLIQKLMDRAEHDALTGLYNRITAQSHIMDYLSESPNEPSAFLVIDIDNFQVVNDTMGHIFGDTVLSEISGKMRQLFKTSDVIGRVGGDEFIVFLKNIPSDDFVLGKATQIIKMLEDILIEEKDSQRLTCSIGAAFYPQHGRDFQQLFQNADIALYKAKRLKEKRFAIYDSTMELPAHAEWRLVNMPLETDSPQ